MAPTDVHFARDFCGYGYFWDGRFCVRRSSWYFWGRWVLASIAFIGALIVLLSCLCLSRRRRRMGAQPMYGTGWIGGGHKSNHNGHQMNNYQQTSHDQQAGFNQQYGGAYTSPPPYGQPPVNNQTTGTTFNTNDGYHGGQQHGVQPPPHTYQPEHQYSAPAGPPPGK